MTQRQPHPRLQVLVTPALMFLVALICNGCFGSSVGSIQGTVTDGTTSSAVVVRFNAMSFPDTGSAQLAIELTNASGNVMTFTLTPSNPSGSTIESQFAASNYTLNGSSNSFEATIPFQGTSTIDVSASDGTFTFMSLVSGIDQFGNPAVADISAEFDITLADNAGNLSGSFAQNFQ